LAALEPNTQRVLDCLANFEPNESGEGWAIGEYIETRTGLKPAEINDAVLLLVDLGYARHEKPALGMAWKFRLVTLTPQGRALHRKAQG
jgi:hypothetical protein